ncbi:hypothetical protein FQZ97_920320 [compost metagenome]
MQAITLQAAEAENSGHRTCTLLAELAIEVVLAGRIRVPQDQHRGLGIALHQLGYLGDGTQGNGQQHARAVRVERRVHRHGHHQHVLATLHIQLAALHRLAQARFVLIEPSLGRLGVHFGRLDLLLLTAERPPNAAGSNDSPGLGRGFGLLQTGRAAPGSRHA